jgi:hypothetical protein
MAGSITAATLYALTLSSPTAIDAVPENAKEKKHHRPNGKGFVNPWESAKLFSVPYILTKALSYDPDQTCVNPKLITSITEGSLLARFLIQTPRHRRSLSSSQRFSHLVRNPSPTRFGQPG